MEWPGIELATSRSQVRRPNHYTTGSPNVWYMYSYRAINGLTRKTSAVTRSFITSLSCNSEKSWPVKEKSKVVEEVLLPGICDAEDEDSFHGRVELTTVLPPVRLSWHKTPLQYQTVQTQKHTCKKDNHLHSHVWRLRHTVCMAEP